MKIVLTIIMCSIIDGKTTCVEPYTFPTYYNDSYTCLLEGYQKSIDKIKAIGRKDVNTFGIYIKFGCQEIILPKPKPKINA